ncbi:hypothetical protein OS493_016640 [Desmophyllum pertusum]|uniref:Uncharacterized protein n=1 Tax=Desmophyllum pertusum TaxID=174260 RepID=A0A9W9ZF10_9CNID|nr:hypothetical protein OS493_016640 [Desmophyllum pertusum]
MLEVSFIGKKFCCDAQFEVADEIDGDGLKLNLKVRETCRQFLKPPGPVLATLHVSVNNGRRNDVTKCKEILAFLKEQVLPKTMKLISLKRIQKVKDEEKSEGVNLLSCIWPGKTRKRKEETKNNCARGAGYSSDTESSLGQSSISDIDSQYQTSSNAGILVTPMLSRSKLLRRTSLETDKDVLGDTKKNAAQKKRQDENKALNHSLKRISLGKGEHGVVKIAHNNLATGSVGHRRAEARSTGNDRDKQKQDKVQYRSEVGLQRVQNEQPDWNSCSDISAVRSFDGFCLFNKSIKRAAKSSTIEENTLRIKHGGLKFVKSNELGLKEISNCLLTQEAVENNYGGVAGLCGAQKHQLKIFAADYVGKICEIALSIKVQETYEAFARDFVESIVSLAKRQITDCKSSQSQVELEITCEENSDTKKRRDFKEHPSFSKVWKYSQVFAPDHDISESLRIKDSQVKDKELDTFSKHCEKEDSRAITDCQYDAELESEVVESPISSNNSLATTSSNSSSESMELCKPHGKTECCSTYYLENEVTTDCALENATTTLQGDKGGAASIDDLTSIPNLGEHEGQKKTTSSKYPQDVQSDCCNREKAEGNETATTSSQSKTEGKQASGNIFTGDFSNNAEVPSNDGRLQPGTTGASKLTAKKQKMV